MRTTSRKMTEDPVLLRILATLNEMGKTEKELTEYLGLGNGAFTPWKYEERKTFFQYIEPIAEYLNVTSDYLLYGVDNTIKVETMVNAEIELIKLYRMMNANQRKCLMDTAKWFAEAKI